MSPTKKSTEKKPAKKSSPGKPGTAKPATKAAPAEPAAKPKPAEPPAPAASVPAAPPVELIDMASLAQELRQPLLQVRKMVQAGQIPGVKVDGEWRFNLHLVREAMLRRSRGY